MYKYFICRLFFADELAGIRRYNTDWLFPRYQPAKLIYFFLIPTITMKKIVASVRKYIFAHRLSSTNELDNVYYKFITVRKKHSKLVDNQHNLV